GEVVHQYRQRDADLRARAAQAEAEVEARARLAVVEERTRIAREMHDVVAHCMSVISVQAAAAQEIARSDPDRTVGILEDIETTGREALTEMRRMLGVLRNGTERPGALSPQPSLVDLQATIHQRIEAGLPTELIITGQQRPLSPGLELAAFRIIQEALTNVVKHAGDSATATVTLHYQSNALTITIADTGQGPASNLADTGGGNGLIGMRERVDAYGGRITVGSRTGGGHEVRVALPVDDQVTRHQPPSSEGSKREQLT
ncbi:MAG: sensor histidine kinase, partial [Acidimicrobiales bacterium]